MEPRKSNSVFIWSAIVLVVAVTSYWLFWYTKKSPTDVAQVPIDIPVQTSPVQTPPVIPPVTPPKPNPTTFVYKNGTYSADGNYFSPGGSETIVVQVTLKDDVIVEAVVQANNPSGGTAERYQKIFIDNFKQFVVGKKIETIGLSKVSGSSLTPKGFNDALSKIKAEAKV